MKDDKPSGREAEISSVDAVEKPPLFGSWKGWYLLVIGFLLFLILFFLYITTRYS
jgi:hypothetical protein